MSSRSRGSAALQYVIILAVTIFLIWLSLRTLTPPGEEDTYSAKWNYLVKTWSSANVGWLIGMAVVAMISHLVRAERWRLLLKPSGHSIRLGDSFLSLMVGYLVNLVIPRGGEISRCYNLYKLDKTPVEVSFGTVVIERLVDVICLLTLVALSFLFESSKLVDFVAGLFSKGADFSRFYVVGYLVIGLLMFALLLFILYKRSRRFSTAVDKIWSGFREGFVSIFRLKNKTTFVVYSVLIWLLYFLMSYTVIKAFPDTEHLGFTAVLSLFAIGSIAMAAPLPGGTGSYHVLVPNGLVFLYGIAAPKAVAFVFIFHGWQTAIMILGGAGSLIATSVLVKRRSSH